MQKLNPKLKLLKDLMYQIADNIDGRQARRTNNATP